MACRLQQVQPALAAAGLRLCGDVLDAELGDQELAALGLRRAHVLRFRGLQAALLVLRCASAPPGSDAEQE